MIEVDLNHRLNRAGHNRRVHQNGRAQFGPQWHIHARIGRGIARGRRVDGLDPRQQSGRHHRVIGRIADQQKLRPARAQHDIRRFGIVKKIELRRARPIVKIALRIAALNDDALGKFREIRIEPDRQRNVGERPFGIDRHAMRLRMDRRDQRSGGGHRAGRQAGQPLSGRDDRPWVVRMGIGLNARGVP